MSQLLTDVPLGSSPFPPIADYAFLSDCETTALVAPSGNVEWLCLPRMDGPSVFASLLDRDAGWFRLGPVDTKVPAGRRYLPGTMIVETTWGTATGWLIVRDVLCIGPWREDRPRDPGRRRAPADHDAEHVLLRTMRCVNGSVEMVLECRPGFDYGRHQGEWAYAGEDYHEAVSRGPDGDPQLRLTTDLRLGFEGFRGARARTTLRDGDEAFVALSWDGAEAPRSFGDAHGRMERTADFWHQWIGRGSFPDHPWRPYLQRSALTLKGLCHAPTGAMVAAPTTSLPETPGGERNFDYRYTWIRDSTFMLWGLYSVGLDWEADDFFFFIADVCDRQELQVMYGIGGERELQERTLDHLTGYDGARPVRVGNGAYAHRQHDVWGALLDSFYLHMRSRDSVPDPLWPILERQVENALSAWREPDRGIWEVRGQPRHFTSSKMFCWVAADRGARLARLRDDRECEERWAAAAAEIHADVLEHGVDERGVLVQHYDTTALDASLLLAPLVRFLPADDERVRATVLAIAEQLTVDGLVLRYRPEETDDGFGGATEGTFTICSFWLVSALAEIGEVKRARALCSKLLGYASPLLLYAEELDPKSGRHLGNFPQAFTHLALINAVMHVVRSDQVHAGAEIGA